MFACITPYPLPPTDPDALIIRRLNIAAFPLQDHRTCHRRRRRLRYCNRHIHHNRLCSRAEKAPPVHRIHRRNLWRRIHRGSPSWWCLCRQGLVALVLLYQPPFRRPIPSGHPVPLSDSRPRYAGENYYPQREGLTGENTDLLFPLKTGFEAPSSYSKGPFDRSWSPHMVLKEPMSTSMPLR